MVDEQEIKELESLLDLFQHPGWKLFLKDFEAKKKICENRLFETKNSDEVFFQQGARFVLVDVLSYESVIEDDYERLADAGEPETA